MPKRSSSLKPSSKSFSRRRRSHTHSSVKPVPQHGTEAGALSSSVQPFSSTSPLFSLPLPPESSALSHSSAVPGSSSSAACESHSVSLSTESFSYTSSSLPSLITPSSPFLSASTSQSLRFSSTASSDPSSSVPSKPCPSTPSSSLASPFVTETQQTPSVAGTYSPNSSAHHDSLYEYVKGLQEAIKSGDADFAERLLQELGEAVNSPSAVALIVSANGARLIASTVRQFRWHGLQKPAKGSMKGGRAGSGKSSLIAKQPEADPSNPPGRSGGSENTRSDDGCIQSESCHSFKSSDHSDGKSLALSHVEISPTSIVAPNESRRKRQRTSGELEEEDDVKEGFSDEIRDSVRAEFSTRSVGEFSGQLHGGTEVIRSVEGIETASRTLGQDNVGLEGKSAEDALKNIAARVVRIRGRYTRIVGSRRYTREPLKVKDRTEISECGQSSSQLDDSDIGGSEITLIQEDVSSRNVSEHHAPDQGNTFCPECIAPGNSNPLVPEEATRSDGMVVPVAGSQSKIIDDEESVADQICHTSGTDSTLSSSSFSENTKNGVCDSRALSRPPNKKLQVDQSAIGLQTVIAQANSEIGSIEAPIDSSTEEVAGPSGQSIEGEVIEVVPAAGNASTSFQSGSSDSSAVTRNQSGGAGRGTVDPGNKGACSKLQGMELLNGAGISQVVSLGDKRITSKCSKESMLEKKVTLSEHSGSDEKKREAPSVYSLAKGAGMPDVVAEGCSALDKLATTAFRGKGAPAVGKVAAVTGVAAAKRGKTFSAEMYVALTEAFVDLLQVLKDNVALLSWCLGCLGSILPPSSSDRNSSESSLNLPASSKAPYVTSKELLKVTTGKGAKHDGSSGVGSQQHSTRSFTDDQSIVKEKESKSSKLLPKLATASYAAAALSAGNGKSSGNAPSTCNGLASESTASSISALAAVAYAATVPMLAEKAVKAVLNAMQSCDIEAHSTHSALRALSAHLSSTNSKYVCDDAFAFIIAAMREFVSDAEMQAESCIALVSLPRAVSSATGHAAWAAITVSMDHHRSNLMVQRAGCGTLQLLCTRTGLGVPEWGSGKRPLRAAKDADRETGGRALIAAMAAFPEDVRIQWHGCSTLWTLVHSAGVRSVANMVRHGAVAAVVGAMSVCRINELMQQEGCNVLGTMARTLAENGHDVGPLICAVASEAQKPSGSTGGDQVGSSTERSASEGHPKHSTGAGKRRDRKDRPPTSPDDWWAALWAVVSAMKAFNKSKSLQSNGTFALGCILKGSGENFHATSGVSPMPGMPLSNSKPSEYGLASSRSARDLYGKASSEGGTQASYSGVGSDGASFSSSFPNSLTGKDVVDDVERMNAVFEVTMTAMREFPKVETVQVWGCAVLQQAFLAYVHYAKRLAPVSMALEASLSAALSPPNSASVFPPLSTIFRTPSSFGNTESIPKPSAQASSSAFPTSSAQSAPMNPKIPSPFVSSKPSSVKFSTAGKSASSGKPDSWRFSSPMSNIGQATDGSINLDRSEGKGAGENLSSSSVGVLQNAFSTAVPGPSDGRTTSKEEVYFPSEKSFTAITSQSQSLPGSYKSGARSSVPIGCTPTISFGESSGATKDHALVVTADPLFSAQKSSPKALSFSSPASSASLSRGSPCIPSLKALESIQDKSEFKSLTSGHQFLGSPSPVEYDFGRGRSLFNTMPHTASSLSQPSPLVTPCDFANLILSNATKAMKMISKTMKLSCSSTTGSSAQPVTKSASGPQAAKSNLKMTTTKSLASRSPTVSVNHSFASVRQSWCAALGAIGDVFGHLTRNSEVALGKGVPRGTDFLEIYKDRKHMHQLGIVEQPSEWNARLRKKDNDEDAEVEHSDDDEEGNVTLSALTIWTHTMAMSGSNLTHCSADVKAYMDAVVQQYKEKEKLTFNGKKNSGVDKDTRSSTKADVSERSNVPADWSALDTVSQQQAVKDIKAWQEATESMGRIAERVGFPKAVKKSIMAVRKILEKLEDAETVIWACHALVSLYLTWENVHLFRPGIETDREEFKSRIWGIGEVGVLQLVDLVIHWTHQNRPDVTSLALQALYSACVFAATVQEIEDVFGPGESGAEAVIGAMQKALSSGGTAHQRRKVIQQGCCVLTTVCGYSIRAQVAIAAAGGADVILAALDRYDEDNQIQVNGMHALGLDARLQPDFDTLWNAAIYRTAPGGVKCSRRKKGSSTSGATLVGLTHIYKEGIGFPSGQMVSESGCQDDSKGEQRPEGSWTPQLERLLLDGASQLGLFRTGLIASPGCGGPAFAVELFKRLSRDAPCSQNAVEMQVHVCLVIGYMTAHDSKWRHVFMESGAVEAVLAAMEFLHKQNRESIVTSFGLMCDGVEVGLDARIDPCDLEERLKASPGNINGVSRAAPAEMSLTEPDERRAFREYLEARLQCAASWALAGLVKDSVASTSHFTLNVMQALAVALLRFGGKTGFKPESARAEKVHAEVCTPARLALARLGVFRIGSREQGRFLSHDAAEAGDLICLETLANKGVDLLMADSQGQTALLWAERAGKIGAVRFLREYAQLQGKRKAREKAKAKNKQGSRKTKLFDQNEIAHEDRKRSHDLTIIEQRTLVEVQESSSCAVNGVLVPGDVEDETDVRHSGSSAAAVNIETMTHGVMPSKEEAKCGAEAVHVASVEDRVEIKGKAKEKKAGRGQKVRDAKESQGDPPLVTGRDDEMPSKWGHSSEERSESQANVVTREDEHNNDCPPESNEEIGSTPQKSSIEQASVKEEDVGDSEETEKLNVMLRQAMSSGDVENLQSALSCCASSGSQADESLVKKVKGALAKRLKRMEKAAALQEELSAAIEEADARRLQEAISEIEKVPRFSVVFKSQLETAKALLIEVEAKERMLENIDTQAASDRSSNLDEVHSIWSEENLEAEEDSTGRASEWSFVEREDKEMLVEGDEPISLSSENVESLTWTDVYKGKRRKETENGDLLAGSLPYYREIKEKGVRCRRANEALVPSDEEVASSSLVKLTEAAHDAPLHFARPREFSENSLFAAEPLTSLSATATSDSPLLPLPPHASTVSPALQPSRSVIMPPRSSGRTLYSPSGHEPITPQLFPVSKGGSVDHSSDHRWGGQFALDSADESPSGSHMARMFASQWSSPYRDDTFHQELQPGSDRRADQSGSTSDSSDSLASLLASIFQSNFSRSSFSTLFSTSFGEIPTPRTLTPDPEPGVKVVASPVLQPVLLSQVSTPVLNVHARPFLPAKSQKAAGPSLPHPSVHHGPAPPAQYSSHTLNANEFSESLSRIPSESFTMSGMPGGFHQQSAMFHSSVADQGGTGAALDRMGMLLDHHHDNGLSSVLRYQPFSHNEPSTGSSLQEVALLAASMEESCCICFDMPKDGALIPCGHRMCKGCAEEMRRIRHHCPICNRSIDAVLALYG
ncbi:hypothetical protein Mapa_005600 [Marchantia paleacea]|nr:hypothetical protein Mapa_005600 [Marchantia paleacea]